MTKIDMIKSPTQNAKSNIGFTQYVETARDIPLLQSIKPDPEKVRIILMPTDKVMILARSNPAGSLAQDCKTVDIKPLTPDNPNTPNKEDWENLDVQISQIAKSNGGGDGKLKKLVLDSHGWTNVIQIDTQGLSNANDPNYQIINDELMGVAATAAKYVESGGELLLTGCHHAPNNKEGKLIRQNLSKIAVANKITITVTATLKLVDRKTPCAILYKLKPDGSIEILTRDYNKHQNAGNEIMNLKDELNYYNKLLSEVRSKVDKLSAQSDKKKEKKKELSNSFMSSCINTFAISRLDREIIALLSEEKIHLDFAIKYSNKCNEIQQKILKLEKSY